MTHLRGIWGFPLTPFAGDRVDPDALAQCIERQLAGGVDVICACGSIAQVDSLSPDEWRVCARTVVEQSGIVPAVVTIPATDDRLELSAAAAALRAAALLVLPHSGNVSEVCRRLRAIAASAPGLPLVLYQRGALELEPDDLRRLCEIDALAGLKDGHRDVRRFRRLHEALGDRLCWISAWEDVALPFWSLGCDAYSPASIAYEPAYSRARFGRLTAGDVAGARRLIATHAYPRVDLRLSRPGIDVSVVQAAIAEFGEPAGDLRAPSLALTTDEHDRVRALLRELDAALAADRAWSRAPKNLRISRPRSKSMQREHGVRARARGRARTIGVTRSRRARRQPRLRQQLSTNTNETADTLRAPDGDQLTIDPANAVAYLRGRGVIGDGPAEVALLGGGVSNLVIAVTTASRRVVVKQALGRLRVAGEWLADPARALAEARALEIAAGLTPGAVPRVLDVDPERNALTIEAAPAGWRSWMHMLLADEADPRVARRLGELLAEWQRETASQRSGLDEWPLFEQLRIDPYYREIARRHPDLAGEIMGYVDMLAARRRCLVHGDFSPKNVLVGDAGLWVIDFEAAHWGDPAFDTAFLTSHLVLKAIALPAARSDFLGCAHAFQSAYRAALANEITDPTYVLGHVGCLMLARVDGKSPVAYLDEPARRRTRSLARSIIASPPSSLLELSTALRETA